jgi:hypothetical protein
MTVLELEREIQAETNLAEELEKYAGEWVAVRQHTVFSHAASLDELLEQISEKEASSADGIFQVPEAGTACYF